MDPAQPPLPRCMYLPFQASRGGSHKVKSISESDVGRATPLTSQCRGTVTSGTLNGIPGGCFKGAGSCDTAETTVA